MDRGWAVEVGEEGRMNVHSPVAGEGEETGWDEKAEGDGYD